MQRLIVLILGDRFPTGMLIVAGLVLVWWDQRTGLGLLAAAVGWSFWESAVLSYRAQTGRPTGSVLKYLILLVTWTGLVGWWFLQ